MDNREIGRKIRCTVVSAEAIESIKNHYGQKSVIYVLEGIYNCPKDLQAATQLCILAQSKDCCIVATGREAAKIPYSELRKIYVFDPDPDLRRLAGGQTHISSMKFGMSSEEQA